jgi:hypothetical protein
MRRAKNVQHKSEIDYQVHPAAFNEQTAYLQLPLPPEYK